MRHEGYMCQSISESDGPVHADGAVVVHVVEGLERHVRIIGDGGGGARLRLGRSGVVEFPPLAVVAVRAEGRLSVVYAFRSGGRILGGHILSASPRWLGQNWETSFFSDVIQDVIPVIDDFESVRIRFLDVPGMTLFCGV